MPRKPSHGLAEVGRVDQALGTIDEALTKSERGEERWCIAELLRIKADLVLLVGDPGTTHAAEELLEQALHWTRRQDVLFSGAAGRHEPRPVVASTGPRRAGT